MDVPKKIKDLKLLDKEFKHYKHSAKSIVRSLTPEVKEQRKQRVKDGIKHAKDTIKHFKTRLPIEQDRQLSNDMTVRVELEDDDTTVVPFASQKEFEDWKEANVTAIQNKIKHETTRQKDLETLDKFVAWLEED